MISNVLGIAPQAVEDDAMELLRHGCERNEVLLLAARLSEVQRQFQPEMGTLERELLDLESAAASGNLAQRAAAHLLRAPGKRIRPLCVFLAASYGVPRREDVAALGRAVELTHAATLLHDDVIDDAALRRHSPTARVVFGNSASVLGGDHLLVEALRTVRTTGSAVILDGLLAAIDSMIDAEAVQLERRGTFTVSRETYDRVVRGKTAALFRWSLASGAAIAGCSQAEVEVLGALGEDLGFAFQLVDDVLDLSAVSDESGKVPLSDVREGKLTWPLLCACEAQPSLIMTIRAAAAEPDPDFSSILSAVRATGALEATEARAWRFAQRATRALDSLPPGVTTEALRAVVHAAVRRGC